MTTEKASPTKLKKYLISYGVKYDWFARQMGLSPNYFYHLINGKRNVPEKHWDAIERLTHNLVKYRRENVK